jgi:hypothetical protein
MNITKADLAWAVQREILSEHQAQALWEALSTRDQGAPKFDVVNLAYYFGAILVMLALGWFLTTCWEAGGPAGLLGITAAYSVGFLLAARRFWQDPGTKVPGGLLAAVAVSLIPLMAYSLEKMFGLWPDEDPGKYAGFHSYIKGSWVVMELATIFGGLLVMRFIAYPFILAPISVALWYLSMDFTPLAFGKGEFSTHESGLVSAAFGILMIVTAYVTDRRTASSKLDFGFWLYFFGVIEFWGGLIASGSGDEYGRLCFFILNLLMMVVSVLLQRRVFVVFGSFGALGYLCHLGYSVFDNWFLFPFVLTGIGLGVIVVAVLYQKNRQRIENAIRAAIPTGLRPYLPLTRETE